MHSRGGDSSSIRLSLLFNYNAMLNERKKSLESAGTRLFASDFLLVETLAFS